MNRRRFRVVSDVARPRVLAGMAFVGLVLGNAHQVWGQERIRLAQDPLAGSRVFGQKGCVKCHSVNGLGGKVGPDLGQISRAGSFYELAAAIWNHVPAMHEQMEEYGIEGSQISAREAGNLIAFLFTLDYFDPPGDVEAGKTLFTTKQCVICHQIGAYGGVIGPSLDYLSQYASPILVAAAVWNHGPAMTQMMESKGVQRPTFKDSELLDLITYLESVAPGPLQGPLYVLPGDPDEGEVVFTEKGCVSCHSVRGLGGKVGPDLATRGLYRGLTDFASAMWNKAPAMEAAMASRGIDVPQLGAGEMADLVAYLYSVQYFADAGDAESGQRLLNSRGCLTCHSFTGRGGSSAGDLAEVVGMDSPAAVMSSLWNHSVYMKATAQSQNVSWPSMSAADIADIMAILQTETANQ
ncbi:MAG TPA: cytochrome c [Gemmatimonadota bacterium]|nr:cytochrome c [Gemmatimonadota bacterium]